MLNIKLKQELLYSYQIFNQHKIKVILWWTKQTEILSRIEVCFSLSRDSSNLILINPFKYMLWKVNCKFQSYLDYWSILEQDIGNNLVHSSISAFGILCILSLELWLFVYFYSSWLEVKNLNYKRNFRFHILFMAVSCVFIKTWGWLHLDIRLT